METMTKIALDFVWLVKQWWFWVGYIGGIGLWWYLFQQRCYKVRDGKPFVRHGRFGEWINLKHHLEDEHKREL